MSGLSHVRLFATLGLQPARFFCPWDFPGKNTGVGCYLLLQGIFLTQGSKLCLLSLLHWQEADDSLPMCHLRSSSLKKMQALNRSCELKALSKFPYLVHMLKWAMHSQRYTITISYLYPLPIITVHQSTLSMYSIPRKWQSTPVLQPGKSHGQRNLVDYGPRGRKELDMTERLHATSQNRKWQPTPVFLPRKSHGQRSVAGSSPWGLEELDTTEATQHTHMKDTIETP